MSHVSEPVFESLPEIQPLVSWTESQYRTRKRPSASEAIAAVFVRSPSFCEFLGMRETGADFIRDVDEASKKIAGFILSGPVEPGKEFLSLLLNGAFDADKLDYMPRDCLMAGVPCALDVARLVEKIHCLQVTEDRVPETYRQWAAPTLDGRYRILALSRAGARALLEVGMTRSILFDKVYHHPKVRALEAMVRRLLTQMQEDGSLKSIGDWMNMTDEDLLRQELPLARSLRSRHLLKRAFSIGAPIDSEEAPLANGEWEAARGPRGPARQWRRLRDDYHSRALRRKIEDMAREVATELGLDDDIFENPIEVDFPDVTKIGLDQFAFVGDGPDDLTRADAALSGERPESAKRVARIHGHVFSPEAAILPTFLAARFVLLKDYQQQYDATCYAATRLDPEEIHAAETRLAEQGFYERSLRQRPDSLPSARLRSHREMAIESFLKTAWPRIEQLGIFFGRYQSQGSQPVSPAGIADFLRQFEDESRVRTALRILEAMDFKDRRFFASSLEKAMKAALQQSSVDVVCPLGSTGDSSALLYYLMNDLPPELRRPVLPLEIALEQESLRGILLWDDFCGAGGHTITTLAQWLGLADERTLSEHLVDSLSPQRRQRFDHTKLLISFGLGMRTGLDSVRDFVQHHQLGRVEILPPPEIVPVDGGVFGRDSLFKSYEERADLESFLKEKARGMLAPMLGRSEHPWSAEKLEGRLLGYGNTGQLLVFYYNVPTVTLTGLWLSGEKAGMAWRPLFPRRPKPSLTPSPPPTAWSPGPTAR